MKVALEKDYKKYYTLEDLAHAKVVIASEKNDEETAAGWARMAITEAIGDSDDWLYEVIVAKAYTAKNNRAFDLYGEGSGNMDVAIEATGETGFGFIKVVAYLSDIWQTGAVSYRGQMFIRYYKEAKLINRN